MQRVACRSRHWNLWRRDTIHCTSTHPATSANDLARSAFERWLLQRGALPQQQPQRRYHPRRVRSGRHADLTEMP
ncbi:MULTISPECIES: hypothetical protein [Xanthomonas]|uniref:hypothetical protein n=1 Tax=Xanthomonas TaxID=338 RepID=UPI0005809CE3|nr:MULTISPECIES: hypothetical protein [Xanthomonas]ATS26415.1 hypothetical protein XppCFBP6164P_13545 [Xanthomonas phaseoli pv. phaseoli]ATS30101.1 hypothetical protein XppCFBP6546P_10080 [Xanthomonas phaseoli pv. phaseoli]AZU11459.1 hypothetical protein AC609_01655 [Xanthomonas phaseoli pv. phaseoli]AZU24218.1 hypothetical protein AC611_01660 [Xanthomonas phaseoli pv. phaseoli]AZU28591.1 hypothetical protein AC801_01630 [Xanthomonas sp. ISO98C4]